MSSLALSFNHLFVPFGVGAALSALVGGLVLAKYLLLQRATITRAWSQTKGIILESAVAVERNGFGQLYRPTVRYHYEVGGARLEGNKIRLALNTCRKYARAREMLDAYKPGCAIGVYYDSERPQLAVLQPSYAPSLQPTLVIGSTAAIYVLFIISPLMVGR